LQQVDCNTILNELLQDLGTTLQETGAAINVEPLPVISGFKTEIQTTIPEPDRKCHQIQEKRYIPQISISAQQDKSNWTFHYTGQWYRDRPKKIPTGYL
jgi:light-regulated signal transduction histidine kinase (bacteriophytochrome)